MPRANAKLLPHFLSYAAPGYHVDHYLLDSLLRTMPPPWPGAPVAWRHARLRRIINEIAASSERMLNQRPLAVPTTDPPAADAFDLAALDAVWCRNWLPPPPPAHTPEAADAAPDACTTAPTPALPAWARQPGWRC